MLHYFENVFSSDAAADHLLLQVRPFTPRVFTIRHSWVILHSSYSCLSSPFFPRPIGLLQPTSTFSILLAFSNQYYFPKDIKGLDLVTFMKIPSSILDTSYPVAIGSRYSEAHLLDPDFLPFSSHKAF